MIYIYLYDLCACVHDVAGQPSMTNRTNTFCQSDSPNHWTVAWFACSWIEVFLRTAILQKMTLKALNFPAWTTPRSQQGSFCLDNSPGICSVPLKPFSLPNWATLSRYRSRKQRDCISGAGKPAHTGEVTATGMKIEAMKTYEQLVSVWQINSSREGSTCSET